MGGVVEVLAARLQADLAPADLPAQLQRAAALAEGRAVPVPLGQLCLLGGGREVGRGGRLRQGNLTALSGWEHAPRTYIQDKKYLSDTL